MSKSLPPELCGIICQDPQLDRRDLHALRAVSKPFQVEAERLLYVCVRLQGARCIKSWCISVLQRPYLALRTKKLMLVMPQQLDLGADDLCRITRSLHLCNNLRDLYVLLDDRTAGLGTKNGDAIHRWILEGHAFRLKRFVNSYFNPKMLHDFLKSQTALETLVLRCSGSAPIGDAPLPMLRTVDSSSKAIQELSISSPYRRQIVRLQVELVHSAEELETFVALMRFRETLRSLSINRKGAGDGLDITVLIACVATQLPDLKYLRILDYTGKTDLYQIAFLPFPVHFKKIDTLVIQPPTLKGSTSSSYRSAYAEFKNWDGRNAAGHRIMGSMPTLKRLVMIFENCLEWRRDQAGKICDAVVVPMDDHDWMRVV